MLTLGLKVPVGVWPKPGSSVWGCAVSSLSPPEVGVRNRAVGSYREVLGRNLAACVVGADDLMLNKDMCTAVSACPRVWQCNRSSKRSCPAVFDMALTHYALLVVLCFGIAYPVGTWILNTKVKY